MFVKSTQDYHSTDVAQPSSSHSYESDVGQLQEASNKKGLGFKATLDAFKSQQQQLQTDGDVNKFYKLANVLQNLSVKFGKKKNSIELLHMAIDQCKIVANPVLTQSMLVGYHCDLQLDFITISNGEAGNKKSAKLSAYNQALEMLQMSYFRLNLDDPENRILESSDSPFDDDSSMFDRSPTEDIQPSRKRSAPPVDPRLFQFFIKEPQNKPASLNSTAILRQSADVNRCQFELGMSDQGVNTRCVVHIGGCLVADVVGPNKLEAKAMACDAGLEFLRTICWTIQTKRFEDTDEAGITKDGLLGEIKADIQQNKISDSNIGNKLLKKMGWLGGGLGKEGNEGIAEPIMVGDVINREGLGLRAEQGIPRGFLPKVKQLVSEYARSEKQKDLVFSPLFSKEERALIHKESQKLGLKSHSHGVGEGRYLVLSRKRTTGQLFSHVMNSGGETDKYVLIPPTQDYD